MKNVLHTFISRFGVFGFVRVMVYPFTVVLTTPVRLVQTLMNCRALVHGKWREFHHFLPCSGLSYLTYWTADLNLSRYGRSGVSPCVGFGNYPLSRWFFYTRLSLFVYRHASTIVLLAGMLTWLLSHLVWGFQTDIKLVWCLLFITLISTTFYANAFALQNYNVLGWAFFPLGIYGILTGHWALASGAWFAASFVSFTVVFIAALLSVFISIIGNDITPIMALMPAALKLCTHFYPFVLDRSASFSFVALMKSLGLYKINVKYKRVGPPAAKLRGLYFLILYLQFIIVYYLMLREVPVIFFAGLIVFIINNHLLRFADEQSMQMMMLSLALAAIMQNYDSRLLIPFVILASPLPAAMPFPFMRKVLDVVPPLSPFSVKNIITGMESFLSPIRSGDRIFMAFGDPGTKLADVYDGYRTLIETARFIATEKGALLMPDLWAIFETNYQGAPDFWGRDVGPVLKNARFWKADYVIIYQNAGTPLESKWEEAGFKVLNKFSWADYDEDLRGSRPYNGEPPDWWLMKKPAGVPCCDSNE